MVKASFEEILQLRCTLEDLALRDSLVAAVARDADTASARLIQHYSMTGDFLAGLIGDGTRS